MHVRHRIAAATLLGCAALSGTFALSQTVPPRRRREETRARRHCGDRAAQTQPSMQLSSRLRKHSPRRPQTCRRFRRAALWNPQPGSHVVTRIDRPPSECRTIGTRVAQSPHGRCQRHTPDAPRQPERRGHKDTTGGNRRHRKEAARISGRSRQEAARGLRPGWWGPMKSTVGRVYAAVIAVLVFFLLWATVSAHPWTSAAKLDPRVNDVQAREQNMRVRGRPRTCHRSVPPSCRVSLRRRVGGGRSYSGGSSGGGGGGGGSSRGGAGGSAAPPAIVSVGAGAPVSSSGTS